MNTLRLLVENLVLIVVLAVFLELLLPAGELRRYVNLVVGLMIIVAVLGAVSEVVDHGLKGNLPSVGVAQPSDLDQALRQGERMARQNQSEALSAYEEALRRQIAALASLNADFAVQDVQLNVTGDRTSPSFGRLNGITLSVVPSPGIPAGRLTGDMERLREELGNFYGLKPEAVSVDMVKGGSSP